MSADFTTARLNMVEAQVRTQDVTDTAIHDAMRAIAREALVPPGKDYAAYADTEVEYAPGRYLLRPRDVAKMIQALQAQPLESALAVAAPYAALVLEHMGLRVERHDGEDLRAIPAGPFDVIVCEGAVAEAPAAWIDALAMNGRLVVIEREGAAGETVVYLKTAGGAARRSLFNAMPPVLPGLQRERRFAF